MRRTLRFLLGLSALLVLTSRVRAGDIADEADLQFHLGNDEFHARHFSAALEHFLASNRLVPNHNVVANIADTYFELKRYPEAYRYCTQALAAERDEKVRARLARELERIAPLVAVLNIETTPPGATVYIDRKDLGSHGQTPVVLGFTAAHVRVLVEADGYENAERGPIDLTPGSTARVAIPMVRVVGTVKLTGNAMGALVMVENLPDVGCAIPCELALPSGRRTLQVSKDGYIPTYRSIEVPAKGIISADFQLMPVTGELVVNSDERGASVEVDGHLVGFTPAVLDVPVGEREMRVSLPGFRTVESKVTIKPGEQSKVEISFAPVQEEVSAVSRTAEKLDDAPSSVSVISGTELQAMNYPTLAEALRGVRGLLINDDGTYTTVGVRGYGPASEYGNKVLILVDGHSTNDDWPGASYAGVDQRTSLDDIDHIEIVRGPGSVVYGTGAFVGVINLVTKPHSAAREATASIATIDNGLARVSATAHQSLGAESGFDLSVAGLDGARAGQYYLSQPDGSMAFSQASERLSSGTVAGKVWYGPLTLQAQATARKDAYPVALDYTDPNATNGYMIDRRAFIEARYEPKLGTWGELLLRASYDRYTEDHLTFYGSTESQRDAFVGDWVDGEARLTLRPHANLRIMLGGEVQDHFHVAEATTGYQAGVAPASLIAYEAPYRFYAGYAVADYFITSGLHLSGGFRLDSYSTFGSSANPRLALIWKPVESDVLKVMAGSAFRAPSIYELAINAEGTDCAGNITRNCTGLRPETVRTGELEWTHRFNPFWTGLASAWGTRIENTIDLPQALPGQSEGSYKNGMPIDGVGFELELRREWRQGWMFELNGSIQRLWFDQGSDPATRLGEVPNSPLLQAGAKFAMPLIPRFLFLMTRVAFESGRWDSNVQPGGPAQTQTPYGCIWDVSLSGQIPEWHMRGSVGVYNIADWQTTQPLSSEFGPQLTQPQAGRRLLANLTFVY